MLPEPGTYQAEWFSIQGRQTTLGEATTVESSMAIGIRAPSEAAGPTILYLLWRVGR